MKKLIIILLGVLISSFTVMEEAMANGADNFYKSDKVTVQKVALVQKVTFGTISENWAL